MWSIAIVWLVFRAQSDTIVLREFINPDEGDLLAGGRRAAMSFIPFKDFTSFTYGPLWPFTLGVLHRLGMPLTLPMAHVLNATVICGACIALAHTIWRRWHIVLAIVTVSPIAVHWSKGFYSQDFYALSTETLSFVFLVLGCLAAFPRTPISQRRALLAAVLLGAAVWAKYSIVIIVAVALVALIVKMFQSGHDLRRTLLTCIGGPNLSLALLVGWAILYGVPLWKIFETFHVATDYLTVGGLARTAPTFDQRIKEARIVVSMFRSMLPLAVLLAASLVVGVAHHGLGSWRGRRITDLPHNTIMRALALVSVAASFASLMVLVPIYPHYAYLFVAGVFLAAFIVASVPPVPVETQTNPLALATVATVAVAAWALPPILDRSELPLYGWSRGVEAKTTWGNVLAPSGGLWDRAATSDGRALSQLCPQKSKVLVWGWAPDLYSQYNWTPATRYVITTVAMTGEGSISDRDMYRRRLLEDFRTERPNCVVDGANAAMYPSWGADRSLDQQWPEFVAEMSSNYSRLSVLVDGTTPMSVWVRIA